MEGIERDQTWVTGDASRYLLIKLYGIHLHKGCTLDERNEQIHNIILTRRMDNYNLPSVGLATKILPTAGADPGGGGWGGLVHPARAPPKIGKNMIFWRKIVIFHTKYPNNFRASLRSAHFF